MANSARSEVAARLPDWFQVTAGAKSATLISQGVASYLDLFSSRQLLYIDSAARCLRQLPEAIRLKLALLISTSLEFNSMLCSYKGAAQRRPGAVRHVFSHHGYKAPYTALENNPLAGSSGTLPHLFRRRIYRAAKWADQPVELSVSSPAGVLVTGELATGVETAAAPALRHGSRRFLLHHGSAVQLPLPDNSVDHVVTDPPYLDYVQYGDLAAFFRGFLRLFLDSAGGVDWDYDPAQTAAVSGRDAYLAFAATLGRIFSECRRVLKPNGRLVFTFHHWRPEAWAALTIALKRAGFGLVAHYVVQSESATSVHSNGMRALVHDTILVLAADSLKETMVVHGQPSLNNDEVVHGQPWRIDNADSERFCDNCGQMLGEALRRSLAEEDVLTAWRQVLLVK
jgi:putative DNA methylase